MNAQIVTHDFARSKLDQITADLAAELKSIWEKNEACLSSSSQLGGALLNQSGDFDSFLKQLFREEYETWALISELVFAEKLFFENKARIFSTDACPKTLEYQSLVKSHSSLTIHAVA